MENKITPVKTYLPGTFKYYLQQGKLKYKTALVFVFTQYHKAKIKMRESSKRLKAKFIKDTIFDQSGMRPLLSPAKRVRFMNRVRNARRESFRKAIKRETKPLDQYITKPHQQLHTK